MSVVATSLLDLIRKLGKIPNAESLILSRCTVTRIPPFLMGLPNLRCLDLSSNPIESLEILWDSNLPALRELNLSACWLKDLPYGVPSFANTLEILRLDGNFLGKSSPNFTVFSKLHKLSLVANDFVEFPKLPSSLHTLIFRLNAFSVIPETSLSRLDVSYCRVIGSELRIESRQITSLNLSHCGLKGKIVFPGLPLLDSVNLSNNSITGVLFASSRRVTNLNASYNGFREVPSFVFSLPMLRSLDLSHNAIDTLPKDLSRMKRLEVLDLSHNQLITPRLILPSKLSVIRAGFNFSIGFEGLPQSLKQLDVAFCSIVTLPSIPQSIEWLALYFVKRVIVRETLKALTLNDAEDLQTALAPASMFQTRTVILTSPASLDVKTLMNESLGPSIGCSATGGRCSKYEDNMMSIEKHGVSFIGVFDGHVGHESAFVSADTFSKILGSVVAEKFDEEPRLVKKAVKRAFSMVNEELRRRAVKDGTTAVIIGVKENRCVVGHVGDSLALLVKRDTGEWLTKPHRPTEKTEYDRMRRQQKDVTEDWRVDGKLCVSRSLGDFWCCDGMYDDPDVSIMEIPEDGMSIVAACDGLWDYVDAGTVCNAVRRIRDPVKASKFLQDCAFASGSHDAISVIVMNLTPRKPIVVVDDADNQL